MTGHWIRCPTDSFMWAQKFSPQKSSCETPDSPCVHRDTVRSGPVDAWSIHLAPRTKPRERSVS